MPAVGAEFNPHKVFRGYFIPESVMSSPDISCGAKLCLSVLYRFIGKKDCAWPGQDVLAARMGMSDRQMRDYLKELSTIGFIQRRRRGQGQTDTYVAIWHSIFEDPTSCLDRNNPATLDRNEDSAPSIELKRVNEESHGRESESSEQLQAVADIEEGFSSASLPTSKTVDRIESVRKLTQSEKQAIRAFQGSYPDLEAHALVRWCIGEGLLAANAHSAPKAQRKPFSLNPMAERMRTHLRDVSVDIRGPDDPDEWIEWCKGQDLEYAALCNLWPEGGAVYSVHIFREGRIAWNGFDTEKRRKTLAYAAWKLAKTDPQWFPTTILSFFSKKPWDMKIKQRTLPDARGKQSEQSKEQERIERREKVAAEMEKERQMYGIR